MALPDPDIALREAADYILTSRLGQKAQLYNEHAGLSLFWRDLLGQIHRLVASCHMPEFTDHGLPHLCSLFERVSTWTCAPEKDLEHFLVDMISPEDAAILFTAILIHDIGMLSQSPSDLPEQHPLLSAYGNMEISSWVRKTHVPRIEGLVNRLLLEAPNCTTSHRKIIESNFYANSLAVASAHSNWPWSNQFNALQGSLRGLAAVLSVSDILDEDANRCDTATLLFHRHGTQENKSHWIRHTMTADRVYVSGGVLSVTFLRLPGTDLGIDPIYQALRNQYNLVRLYNDALRGIGAGSIDVRFEPQTGCPKREVTVLSGWERIQGFETQGLLLHNILKTFFPEALLDARRVGPSIISLLKGHGLEHINLDTFYSIQGLLEVRSPIEEEIRCAIGPQNTDK